MASNSIFGTDFLKRKLSVFSFDHFQNIDKKKEALNELIRKIKSGRVELTKEKSQQADFLNTLFGDVLGYEYRDADRWNLEKEQTSNVGGKYADGTLGYFTLGKGEITRDTRAVIELKDSYSDPDRPQNRTDKRTPVEQAFSYVPLFGGTCKWVLVSNFKELRLYHSTDATRYEIFDIQKLTDEFEFKRLLFLLHKDRLILELQKSPIEILYDDRQQDEKTITKKFYVEYKEVRLKLFGHLKKNNPSVDETILLNKAQKILDRVIFICFCEDLELIPERTFRGIVDRARKIIDFSETKLWGLVKNLFKAIDRGYPDASINKFNGGLFAEDKTLDGLVIHDEVIFHLVNLADNSFKSDLNVNILGHIFEQSISDIEELKARIEGKDVDATKGKKKKDGVFYTPPFVTNYMVKRAVGGWLEERKLDLGVDTLPELSAADFDSVKLVTVRDKSTKKNVQKLTFNKNIEKHITFWEAYREKLAHIRVLDPSCGSGAFLNQVFDFLHNEGEMVNNKLADLKKGQRETFDLDKHILTNNIFGVDLNEESVEITKLSLWLKTANKYKELTTLDDNIRCGNSLISKKEIAGEKAFDWENAFEEILIEEKGFDVIVGNPPYVGEKGHSEIFDQLKQVEKWNEFYRRRSNTYYFFIKLGIDLLKKNGIQSLIVPREFTNADWANKVRKEILTTTEIKEIVDFNDLKVFEDAGTTSLILTIKKIEVSSGYSFPLKSIRNQQTMGVDLFAADVEKKIDTDNWDFTGEKIWNFYQKEISDQTHIVPLSSLFDVSQGLVSGADRITRKHVIAGLASEDQIGRGIFMLRENIDYKYENGHIFLNIRNSWIELDSDDEKLIKPYLRTEGLLKWKTKVSTQKVIYSGVNMPTTKIKEYLNQFALVLVNRSTTVPEGVVITMDQFEKFTIEEIKNNFSSAGAVQKIMKRKQWYLPLYERLDVPFAGPKIIVNTKNMDKFTYSDTECYSSGGGAGGQNFIYPVIKKNEDFFNEIREKSSLADFVKFTNAVLNSSLIQKFISDGQFNQLSTDKIGDLKIIIPNLDPNSGYYDIVALCNRLIDLYEQLDIIANDFLKLLQASFSDIDIDGFTEWYRLNFIEFISQLREAIGKDKIAKSDELNWLKVFEDQKKQTTLIQNSISGVELDLDKKILELYN